MSLLTRPSVVFAIVFGCFAVLIPRIFLPLFRSKPPVPSHNYDDHFRRPPPPMTRNEHGDTIQHIPGSPPHMRGAHPSMRMHHPAANNRHQPTAEQSSSKSIVTLALPMYTVGIGVFFIYTCCKYWSKKNSDETKPKKNFFNDDLLWNNEKRKIKYDILDKDSEEDEENKEDFYANLDSDYLEYLKLKKQKALDAERMMTEEQKQMHYALEEMKKSLSFISSKLVTKESRGNLNGNEIVQLQERLASTEAQMCKILAALDVASDKVKELTEKPEQVQDEKQQSATKSLNEEESSSSPSDEDEEQEQNQSESISSTTSSAEDDQSAPIDEQNRLTKRKH